MATNDSTATRSTAPKLTAMDFLLRDLQHMEAAGNYVRNFLAEKFAKSLTDAEYEMRWLEGKYGKIVLGSFASTSLAWLNDMDARHTTFTLEENFREQLKHWRPEQSTSAYSNACNNEKFGALKEIIEVVAKFHVRIKQENAS